MAVLHKPEAQVGVCNGQLGNNLPSNQEVANLYKSNGIRRMRMYAPNPQALQALRGSNIELVLDVPNSDIQRLTNADAAYKWVQDNVRNYYPDVKFRIIAVGNEVNPNSGQPTAPLAQYVLSAMSKIYDAIASASLKDQIKVSTATYSALISNSFPPSKGSFDGASGSFMRPIINFLKNTNPPLLVNIYAYFSRIGNPQAITLQYALFTISRVVAQDGQFQYRNLFDAMLDAAYAAVEKVGGPNVEIVVSVSGWPSAGGPDASPGNAGTYYRNLINHVKAGGSPRRPGKAIETYLFAMFDENRRLEPRVRNILGFSPPTSSPNTN